jgi:hypothetical protein
MKVCADTPINVPNQKIRKGILKIGEAKFTNQFGRKGENLKNKK